MHFCENLGSRAPSVTSREEWVTLETFLRKNIYNKRFNDHEIWLPLSDRKTESVWKDYYSGKNIENYTQPWIGERPDGGVMENCARIVGGSRWGDKDCDWPKYGCMCSYKPRFYLRLRGLFPRSAIDVFYKPMSDRADFENLQLLGLTGSSLTYDEGKRLWQINVAQSNLSATSKGSQASFALGKYNWTIIGDVSYNAGAEYVTELKMSGCEDGDFTCDDGQCVKMYQRCNQMPNCRDESDETNCQVLVLKKGYNKNVPPINSDNPVVNVSVSIDLLKLVDIDEPDYSIKIQFEIMLKWKENRATYNNLKKADALNALIQKDISKLWLPEVIYENTDNKESTRLGEIGAGEWKTKVVVQRAEEYGVLSGLGFVDETMIFLGSKNSLIMNQSYSHTFQCNYELARYPFDTQVKLQKSFILITY